VVQKELIHLTAAVPAVPDNAREVVDAVALASPRLGTVVTPKGNIKRELLREVLTPTLSPFGVRPQRRATFTAKELDYSGPDRRIGVAVQAGRAFTNNGALVSLLTAASSPELDWVVITIPETYMNNQVYPKVLQQFRELQGSHGIHLDLQGVILISY
jgi:hypothetical protein